MMKRMLFVIFSFIVISGCTADNNKDVPAGKTVSEVAGETAVNVGGGIGDIAPDFNAISLDGKRISYYNDLKGKKPVYLIFWATW